MRGGFNNNNIYFLSILDTSVYSLPTEICLINIIEDITILWDMVVV